MIKSREKKSFLLALKKYTVPVYFSDPQTPRYRVRLTASWAPALFFRDVPIPDHAEADPADDGHMVVIDKASGYEYDLFQARKKKGEWTAGWANRIPFQGKGIYEKGLSCRGSGFALLGGVVWPQELKKGHIPHALLFSYDYTKAGGPVAPASQSDGESKEEGAIPEGARVQLDPKLDLSKLGLTPFERTIAKCLQEYGMILRDGGGGVQLYGINPYSVKNNPYEGILPNQTYVHLPKIPFKHFRVLKMPLKWPIPIQTWIQNTQKG